MNSRHGMTGWTCCKGCRECREKMERIRETSLLLIPAYKRKKNLRLLQPEKMER